MNAPASRRGGRGHRELDVREVRAMLNDLFMTKDEVARKFGVQVASVDRALSRAEQRGEAS